MKIFRTDRIQSVGAPALSVRFFRSSSRKWTSPGVHGEHWIYFLQKAVSEFACIGDWQWGAGTCSPLEIDAESPGDPSLLHSR